MTDRRDLYADLLPLLDSPSRDPVREVAPSGGRAWSFCPCHSDGTKHGKRSLSLHPTFGLDCFAGCAFRDIVQALRARSGGHPARSAPTATYARNGNGRGRLGGTIVAARAYRDEEGQAVFRVVRKQWPDGGKTFLQQHPSGSGACCQPGAVEPCKPAGAAWRWKRGGARYVLYRLPELLAADPAEMVFLVEGEKCADALASLGLVATTNSEGAGKWRPEYTEALRERRVVILPDNDRSGADHAEAVGKALLEVAEEMRFVVLPDLAYKGDVVDWLADGGSREALLTLAERAPIARPPSAMFPNAVDTRVLDATGVSS